MPAPIAAIASAIAMSVVGLSPRCRFRLAVVPQQCRRQRIVFG
jgi:hypothetical protein